MRALWLLLAMPAVAGAGGLAWHAPDGCPDVAAVRSAIERRLEASLDTVTFAVDVGIVPAPDGFIARVTVADSEPRTLASGNCAELTDAVAIVVARLAIAARIDTPPSVARPRPADWDIGARADLVAGSGSAPELDVGGEVAAWLVWRRLRFELGGEHWRKTSATLDGTNAGVDVQLDALAVRAGLERGVLRAWIGGEVGVLHGTGFGLMAPRSGDATWLAAGAGVGGAWPLGPHVRVVVGCELEIPFDRVGFALGSGMLIYRTSPLALRGGLGVELGWR